METTGALIGHCMYGYFAITCIHRQTDSQILLLFCAHAGRQRATNACMFDWFLHLFDAHVQVGTDNISLSLFVSLPLSLSLALALVFIYRCIYIHTCIHACIRRKRVSERVSLVCKQEFLRPMSGAEEIRRQVAEAQGDTSALWSP